MYGDTLPDNLLSVEEYAIYERLYGPPIPTKPSHSAEESAVEEDLKDDNGRNVWFRESAKGVLEAVECEAAQAHDAAVAFEENGERRESEQEDGIEADPDRPRLHPFTTAGRFSTFPSTLQLPAATFTGPINHLLSNVSSSHVKQAAEDIFGGPGLPFSPAIPRSKRLPPQMPVSLQRLDGRTLKRIEADAYLAAVTPGAYAATMSVLVETRKRLGTSWLRALLGKEGGARVLDAGAKGAGIVAWREIVKAHHEAAEDVNDLDATPAYGQATVVCSSETLRDGSSVFLDNTTFLPRLPDYLHAASVREETRKKYDIIIAPYMLWTLKEEFQRKELVEKLWSLLDPRGGVLILIEKGLPRGFEAIASVREHLLGNRIVSPDQPNAPLELQPRADQPLKEPGMIVAPCTTHAKCPMYHVPGLTPGRKDYCHFSQRFIRPSYLQQILGASDVNHEDVKFSYVAVRRGRDERTEGLVQGEAATDAAFAGPDEDLTDISPRDSEKADIHSLSLPRSILPPLKRRGHVTLDLCTPAGRIERWTVPRSFSKQAYHDARKSKWGDLWALGAKTRVQRKIRLGREEQKPNRDPDRDGRNSINDGERDRHEDEEGAETHRPRAQSSSSSSGSSNSSSSNRRERQQRVKKGKDRKRRAYASSSSRKSSTAQVYEVSVGDGGQMEAVRPLRSKYEGAGAVAPRRNKKGRRVEDMAPLDLGSV
ncbi:MAG: 37S ribosomal protein S22 [Thelocarpon superellum]|nr:MAG: 37S ribosomal protein S22 [Thelocarpon superellum]